MYRPWTCRKCGAQMSGPNDHDTTAGCSVAWPNTITTGDTAGFVHSEPTTWGSEQGRRLARYDEAIRLLEDWRKFGDLETNEMPYGDTAAFLAAEGKVAG